MEHDEDCQCDECEYERADWKTNNLSEEE